MEGISGQDAKAFCGQGEGGYRLQVLPALQNLRWLDLSGTRITDRSVPHLRKMKHLEVLGTENSGLSDSAIAELKKALQQTDFQ